MKKKVLILCPPFSDKGGVAFYYSLVEKHFKSEKITLDFYHTGKDYKVNHNRTIKSLQDLLSLIRTIPNYDLIILNPSLDLKALFRDGTYQFLAKRIFQKKTLIFFHGWINRTESKITKYWKHIFKHAFAADKICVLAEQFKQTFISWGFDPDKIIRETTLFESHGIETEKDPFSIIFLSRFEKNKGCKEAIQSVELLLKEFPNLKLYMVGDGPMASELKAYTAARHIDGNIKFTGYLIGESKYNLIEQCGIMLYPTYYGEGMPISILEGMGMGLAVITRPVGGIQDIISNDENGFLVQSTSPTDFASKLKILLYNTDKWKKISHKNRQEAENRFEIRRAVKRLERLYCHTLFN